MANKHQTIHCESKIRHFLSSILASLPPKTHRKLNIPTQRLINFFYDRLTSWH